MNEYIGFSLLFTFLIFLLVIGIITEKRKRKIRSELIKRFQFEKHNFIKKVENKEYERKTENGFEFVWINKNKDYLTLNIGINFIPTKEYQRMKFIEYLKFGRKFDKKFKSEKYQLLGQNNPIITLELKIKKVNQIPGFYKVEEIFNNMLEILRKEKLIKKMNQ